MAEINVYKSKMIKSIEALERELASIRAGRANPAVLDKVTVDYYGVATPVNQLAAVAVPEPRMLTIQPWDPSTLRMIEKAINMSDIGINPQNDSKIIRLVFPPLTEERRKEIVKTAKKDGEDTKVAIRNIRRDAIDDFKKEKKDGIMTEDDVKNAEKSIQDLTEKYCKEVDGIVADKEKEIMSI